MAALVCVKGRNADEAVNPLFRFQIAVCVLPFHFQGDALDARFVSVQPVELEHLISPALRITHVHTIEQRHPIARLRAARARMEGQNGVRGVVFSL